MVATNSDSPSHHKPQSIYTYIRAYSNKNLKSLQTVRTTRIQAIDIWILVSIYES